MSEEVIDLISLSDGDVGEEATAEDVVDLISVDDNNKDDDNDKEDDVMEDENIKPDEREYEFTIHGTPKTWKRPKTHVSVGRGVGSVVRYLKNTVNPNKQSVKYIRDTLNASLRSDYELTDENLEDPLFNGGMLVVCGKIQSQPLAFHR